MILRGQIGQMTATQWLGLTQRPDQIIQRNLRRGPAQFHMVGQNRDGAAGPGHPDAFIR